MSWTRRTTETVLPTSLPSTAVLPPQGWIDTTAALLAGANRPMILVGDGVAYSGAQATLARVAELLGAEVWGVDSGELNMSYAHPPSTWARPGTCSVPAALPRCGAGTWC